MKKIILFIFVFAINITEANYPESYIYYVPSAPRITPYAYVDFSQGYFSRHEYAYRGTRSVALSFGLTF